MSRKAEFNPFYAMVVVTGVAFVVTVLAYVVSLVRVQVPGGLSVEAAPANPLLEFFGRRGESLMLWEAATLAVTAILAMGLDRWRSWHAARLLARDDAARPQATKSSEA